MNRLIPLNSNGKKVLVAVTAIAYVAPATDWKGSPTTGCTIYFIGGNMSATSLSIDESLEEVQRMVDNARP